MRSVPAQPLGGPGPTGTAALAEPSEGRQAPLEGRIEDALARATAVTGADPPPGEAVGAALAHALQLVAGRLRTSADEPRAGELAGLLIELQELREEQAAALLEQRAQAIAGVQAALGRLRRLGSVAELREAAPLEACRACGFDRAALLSGDGANLTLESAHFHRQQGWANKLIELSRHESQPLRQALAPLEMMRQRGPILVSDPAADPRTSKPLVEASGTRSFVAAPIMPQGRVIGFLLADRHFAGEPVDSVDRDLLWTFAEGFGQIVERAALLGHLRAQRDRLHALLRTAEGAVGELVVADVELSGGADGPPRGEGMLSVRERAGGASGPAAALRGSLTRRELEVLELMSDGSTNARIAAVLVISEGTVKSHVKHILRKLRAANRAEAVSRYLRLRSDRDGNGNGARAERL